MSSLRRAVFAAAAIAAIVLGSAGAVVADDRAAVRLHSPVDAGTLQLAEAAVARGDKVVEVGDWSRPDGVSFQSGGDARIAREIAGLFRANGVRVRVVGLAGSALAEISLNAAGCSVSRNGQIVPHLAFVPNGTRAQDRAVALESARWWLQQGGTGNTARADLVNRLERSPDQSWRMRTEELRAEGCAIE